MKKGFIAVILILLLFPIVTAVEFKMKTEFKQGETLLAEISGNFQDPILKENVLFYKRHVRIPMEFEIAKLSGKYYIYAQLLGKTPNNYSISIENVRYLQGAETSEEPIVQNFTITDETADFSVEPGFITTTQKSFFIEVQNLQDYEITINAKKVEDSGSGFFDFIFGDGETDENSVTLMSGESKKISFEFENITQSELKKIELSTGNLSYEIPVYMIANETSSRNEIDFKFEPSEQIVSMATNSNSNTILYLFNKGDTSIKNISLDVSNSLKKYVNLSIYNIEELKKDNKLKIEVYITSGAKEEIIEGQITAIASEVDYAYSALILNLTKDYVASGDEENQSSSFVSKNCEELEGGVICNYDEEECSEGTLLTKNGACCLGTCEKITKSSSGKIIGWVILVVVILLVFWFFKQKYGKTKYKKIGF